MIVKDSQGFISLEFIVILISLVSIIAVFSIYIQTGPQSAGATSYYQTILNTASSRIEDVVGTFTTLRYGAKIIIPHEKLVQPGYTIEYKTDEYMQGILVSVKNPEKLYLPYFTTEPYFITVATFPSTKKVQEIVGIAISYEGGKESFIITSRYVPNLLDLLPWYK